MIFGNLGDDDFFLKRNDGGLFLKRHEAWVNAPSLEHKSMSLKKNFS